MLEETRRSVRLGVSFGVAGAADGVAVPLLLSPFIEPVIELVIDFLSVLCTFGIGGLSFLCCLWASSKNLNHARINYNHNSRWYGIKGIKMWAVLILSIDIPVPAMLAGRGFRVAAVDRLYNTPDTDVDVDKALPGREPPPGVTSPDLEPK